MKLYLFQFSLHVAHVFASKQLKHLCLLATSFGVLRLTHIYKDQQPCWEAMCVYKDYVTARARQNKKVTIISYKE